MAHGSIIMRAFGVTLGRQKKAEYCCPIILSLVEVYECTKATPDPCWSGSGFTRVTTAANSDHEVIPITQSMLKQNFGITSMFNGHQVC